MVNPITLLVSYEETKDQIHQGPDDLGRSGTVQEKAKEYKTVSHYVRRALEEYSNMNIRQQIELMNDLGTFYQKYQNELSWAGSNLNQAMKRANELSVAGLLAPGYLREVLLPTIQETQHTLTLIKRELETLMLKSIRSAQPETSDEE